MSSMMEYKCPNCGGKLEFNATSQKLKCPYCDGEFDPNSFSDEVKIDVKNETWQENDLNVYTCNSCGGIIMTDKDTVATACPYCGSPVVLSGNLSGTYRPTRIIPFKLDKKQAIGKYEEHLKGKKLLPDHFKNLDLIEEIKGIYVPFWLFDGKASGQAWYDACKIRTWSDSDFRYTETSNYKVFRSGYADFSKVPVDGSTHIDDDLSQSIEPYDNSELINFNENYLPGYLAEKYNVESSDAVSTANNRIQNSMTSLLDSTVIGYDSIISSRHNVSINKGQQEYVMYPMWILTTKYNEQNYLFAMNGQTGKFVGNLPTDNKKLLKYALLTFLIVSLVVIALQFVLIKAGIL